MERRQGKVVTNLLERFEAAAPGEQEEARTGPSSLWPLSSTPGGLLGALRRSPARLPQNGECRRLRLMSHVPPQSVKPPDDGGHV